MWTGAFAIVITELYCFVERLENNTRHFNMAEQILVQQNVPTVYRHTDSIRRKFFGEFVHILMSKQKFPSQ